MNENYEILELFNRKKNYLKNCFFDLKSVLDQPEIRDEDYCKTLMARKNNCYEYSYKKYCENQYEIAVIGVFNAGKSTLINALLGEELMPAKSRPCTATSIKILYGPEKRITKLFYTNDPAQISSDVSGILNKDAVIQVSQMDEAISKQKLDEYSLQIEYPLDICKEGIVLYDTPGVKSMDETKDGITWVTLKDCDAIVYIFLANQAASKNDAEFLQKILAWRTSGTFKVLLVINQKDIILEKELATVKKSITEMIEKIKYKDGVALSEVASIVEVSSKFEMCGQLLRQGKDDSVTKYLFENEQIEPFYNYCRKSGFNDLRKAIDETFDSTSKSKRLFDDCYQELFSILTAVKTHYKDSVYIAKVANKKEELKKVIKEIDEKKEIIYGLKWAHDEINSSLSNDKKKLSDEWETGRKYDFRQCFKEKLRKYINDENNEFRDMVANKGNGIQKIMNELLNKTITDSQDSSKTDCEDLAKQLKEKYDELLKKNLEDPKPMSNENADYNFSYEYYAGLKRWWEDFRKGWAENWAKNTGVIKLFESIKGAFSYAGQEGKKRNTQQREELFNHVSEMITPRMNEAYTNLSKTMKNATKKYFEDIEKPYLDNYEAKKNALEAQKSRAIGVKESKEDECKKAEEAYNKQIEFINIKLEEWKNEHETLCI